MERGRDAAAVEQEDRLAPALGELAELREQRRGQRVAGLAAQVDRAHRRTADADSLAELEPLEPLPALGARRRASVNRDGAFQRGALRSHRARVVARVGLLLVRRRRALRRRRSGRAAEAGRRRPSAHRSRSAPPLTRCARARRAAPPRSATSAGSPRGRRNVPGSGRPSVARARSRGRGRSRRGRGRAPLPRPAGRPRSSRCRWRRRGGSGRRPRRMRARAWRARAPAWPSAPAAPARLQSVPLGRLRQLLAARALRRSDERERAAGRRAVVVREPERELDERCGQRLDDALDRSSLDPSGGASSSSITTPR